MNGNRTDPIIIQVRRLLAPVGVFVLSVALSPQTFADCECQDPPESPCDTCVDSGDTCTITGPESANCMEVRAGGVLNIDPDAGNATLTLGTGAAALESPVDGQVRLLADPTYRAALRFTTVNHTVTGSGDIVGQDDDAEIVIDAVALTSEVDIRGHMHIKDGTGPGSFVSFINDGAVIADAVNGTLDLGPSTICGCGQWQVTASGAMLRFLTEPCDLPGSFTVSDGTLRAGTDASADDIDVCTSGDLIHTGGKIVAGVDDSFVFNN